MDQFSSQLSKSLTNLSEKLGEWLNTFILQLPNLIIAIIVGLIAYFLTSYIRKASVKTSKKFTKNRTVLNLISNLSAVIFGVIILFIILSLLNLDDTINKILATAGVLGLAVGLALQDPMNNLFSGVFMSVRDLYKIGDIVETNGYFGTIRNIDLRATKLRLPTGQDVVIPNKEVIQSPLTNYNSSGLRRVDIECGVTYDADLANVEKLTISVLNKIESRVKEQPVDFIYNEFGGSSINFTARFWIDTCTQKDYLLEKSKGIKAIKKAFDENNITIPFPIRTLDFGIEGGKTLQQMLINNKNTLHPTE